MTEPDDRPADEDGRAEASNDTGRRGDDSSAAEPDEEGTWEDDAAERDADGSTAETGGEDGPEASDGEATDDDATGGVGVSEDDSVGDDSAGDDSVDDDSTDGSEGDDDTASDDTAEDDPSEEEPPGGDDESDSATAEPESALPPVQPAPFVELMAAYRQPATAGAERLPWSWSTLSPGEREASATVLDGFVESYNRTWAIYETQTVPPCWHRHPALAHDLATLAWAYFQAYRDPTATPDRALRFQAQLPAFAERVDRWLGADPGGCRGGRHPDSWRDRQLTTGARRSTTEDADAVILLGAETFGFAPPPPNGE